MTRLLLGQLFPAARPRPCGQSQDVHHEHREPEETGEVSEGLFVACGDSAELFESAEEAFDLVSISVADLVVAFFCRAVFVGLDAGLRLQSSNTGSRFIAIVGGVSQHLFDLPRLERLQQLPPQAGRLRPGPESGSFSPDGPARRWPHGAWYLGLRAIDRDGDRQLLFFGDQPSATDRSQRHLDGRGIELQFLQVHVAQLLHDILPNPLFTPAIKPTPSRIPIPKTFRQVSPRHALFSRSDNTVFAMNNTPSTNRRLSLPDCPGSPT